MVSKANDLWRELVAEAKQHHTWELAEATNNFQWNIYQLRKKKGWTQAELAKRMGVSQSWVGRHAAGWTPNLESIAKYAHAFGVNPADIIGDYIYYPPYPIFNEDMDKIGEYSDCATNSVTINIDGKFDLVHD